ncbi:uncharacterized protein TNCV_4537171 [Trichonephila clavipes]|nr:uncharacterized protein TNCV_4537171 [Trichonephila clavipes]
MPPRKNKAKFQQLTEFERWKIFLTRNRSSCAAEQFHNGASLEVVDRRAPNNSKNWQWTTEGNISARRLTPDPHGGG